MTIERHKLNWKPWLPSPKLVTVLNLDNRKRSTKLIVIWFSWAAMIP